MRPRSRTADRQLARIATTAHGVATRAQLLHAGVSIAEIKHRLESGALLREEQDRRREREARARGDEFRRYTNGDVFEDPGAMLRELRALISRSSPA